ncbi:16S rRNA (cytosine(1402)-N(4))-methyltransferase RsmH [Candidatus Neomarinimicrobiota bacterium]
MDTVAAEIVHVPVMVDEVLDLLITSRSGLYIDGTIGMGGHTAGLLTRLGPNGRVLGIDLDPGILSFTKERLFADGNQVILRHGSFAQMPLFLQELGIIQCQGILLDLGLSSYDLESSGRGFSFQSDESLDMRFDPEHGQPLFHVLPHLSLDALENIIAKYGEERHARTIAKAIFLEARSNGIESSAHLADTVRKTIRGPLVTKCLARVFQAFRIFINDELNSLQTALERISTLLETGRRAVVISYHSLEDRLVKHFFLRESKECICPPHLPQCICGHTALFKILTPKPIVPTVEEQISNPRCRSAKLRAVERL